MEMSNQKPPRKLPRERPRLLRICNLKNQIIYLFLCVFCELLSDLTARAALQLTQFRDGNVSGSAQIDNRLEPLSEGIVCVVVRLVTAAMNSKALGERIARQIVRA